jgi:hypothetical protein
MFVDRVVDVTNTRFAVIGARANVAVTVAPGAATQVLEAPHGALNSMSSQPSHGVACSVSGAAASTTHAPVHASPGAVMAP